MGVDQRTGEGSKPRIRRVVSKSDSDHWSGYYGHRTLGRPRVLFAVVLYLEECNKDSVPNDGFILCTWRVQRSQKW